MVDVGIPFEPLTNLVFDSSSAEGRSSGSSSRHSATISLRAAEYWDPSNLAGLFLGIRKMALIASWSDRGGEPVAIS